MKALIRAIALCYEMGNSAARSSFAKREVMPGNLAGRALESFVRDAATACLHQNCTAKMAPRRIGTRRSRWRNASASVGRGCGGGSNASPRAGSEGLLRDKTRKPGKAPIAAEKIEQRDAPPSDLNEPPRTPTITNLTHTTLWHVREYRFFECFAESGIGGPTLMLPYSCQYYLTF
jgi:hypothetical protein